MIALGARKSSWTLMSGRNHPRHESSYLNSAKFGGSDAWRVRYDESHSHGERRSTFEILKACVERIVTELDQNVTAGHLQRAIRVNDKNGQSVEDSDLGTTSCGSFNGSETRRAGLGENRRGAQLRRLGRICPRVRHVVKTAVLRHRHADCSARASPESDSSRPMKSMRLPDVQISNSQVRRSGR
jgi:hypothetical protein